MIGDTGDGLVNAIGASPHIHANADCQVKAIRPLPAFQQNAAGLLAPDQHVIRPFEADSTLGHMRVNGFSHGQGGNKGQIGGLRWPTAQRKKACREQIAGLPQPRPTTPSPALGLFKAAHP